MIGTIVYILLDVSFNVVIWTSQKTINGICNAVNYTTNTIHNYKMNKNENTILALEPPTYEEISNIGENIIVEETTNEKYILIKKRDKQIKELINKQEDILIEFKKLLNNNN